jgi:NAD(P)-dependent dehydrogenase (short-subunit alcohol dehydrogenase family)
MDEMMPAGECTDELWARVLQVNLTAPFILTRTWLNRQIPLGGGSIVNIASVGGLRGARAGVAYTASKHGVVGLTQNVAFMYAQKGVRCNAIAPGGVDTEIAAGIKNPSPFGLERATAGLSLNPRTASAEEVAQVALFLASDDASIVNGIIMPCDAGWTAY